MLTQKTCFVISPIGDEDSDIRVEADALLWIIRQALEKYRFRVVRIDEIARSTQITSEILRYVRESTLCVIILTGENPNVFYEAGRRHETNKPFIQLIRKGERIPFDIANIRTIIYDNVDSRLSAAKTIDEIQRFVDEFEDLGWPRNNGISDPLIAASLERIERQLSLMSGGTGYPIFFRVQSSDPKKITDFLFKNPKDAFDQAVEQGDLHLATRAVIRMEELIGPSKEVLEKARTLVMAYHEPGVDIIIRLLTEHLDKLGSPSDQAIKNAINEIANFYIEINRPNDCLTKLGPLFDLLIEKSGTDLEARATKAFYYSYLCILHMTSEEYDEALDYAQEAVRLTPEDGSHLFILAVIYMRLENYDLASSTADRYIDLGVDDLNMLLSAVEVYKSAAHKDKIVNVYKKLSAIHPDEASKLLQDESIKEIIEEYI